MLLPPLLPPFSTTYKLNKGMIEREKEYIQIDRGVIEGLGGFIYNGKEENEKERERERGEQKRTNMVTTREEKEKEREKGGEREREGERKRKREE